MTATLLRSLAEIVGPAHCLGGADRAPFVVDGRTPCGVVLPGSADEVARVVRAAAAAGVPVVPWGGGTQMSRGAPPRDGALVVGLRRLGRVLEHEPGDLTATAEAGITLDALQAALGDARPVAAARSAGARGRRRSGASWRPTPPGPRRQGYGTARDLVIGMRVVAADGQLIRAGGKVVKNVAGYDLVKLYIGSLGTLGIIVDATLKLRPRPEAEGACWATFPTLDARGGRGGRSSRARSSGRWRSTLLDARAADACARAAGLPAGAAPAVLVAFDGLARTVAWQGEEAARRLRAAGARAVEVLDAGGHGARARGRARDAAPPREPGRDRDGGRAAGGRRGLPRRRPRRPPGRRGFEARRRGARGPRAGDARSSPPAARPGPAAVAAGGAGRVARRRAGARRAPRRRVGAARRARGVPGVGSARAGRGAHARAEGAARPARAS